MVKVVMAQVLVEAAAPVAAVVGLEYTLLV
jgi:hypothetical protein